MAIVFAIQKWRHYLMGRRFIVKTDQKSLKFFLEQREINLEYQKWLTKILDIDFEIQYRPGLENKAADALSRNEPVAELFVLSMHAAIQLETISSAVDQDGEVQKVIADLKLDPTSHQEY